MWLSLVERCVRDAEVAGSNPVIPTTFCMPFCYILFSEGIGKLYLGHTEALAARVDHNAGRVNWTSRSTPGPLVY